MVIRLECVGEREIIEIIQNSVCVIIDKDVSDFGFFTYLYLLTKLINLINEDNDGKINIITYYMAIF